MPPRRALHHLLLRASLILASAILFVPLMLPLLTWRVMTSGDLAQFHLPMRFIYQQALLHGDSFLWSPALGSGVYLHAEGQSGMAHPFHVLIYRLLPLTAAFNVEMLASYVFAWTGMWQLLRRLAFAREASLAGALLFAFSGFTLLHLNHLNFVAVVAHAPWLLWSADLVMSGGHPFMRAAGFAATGVVVGSEILLGFPQAVWLDGLLLAWFMLFRLTTGVTLQRAVLVAGAVMCGVLIGGVQLLPTLDAARASLRAATTMAFRTSYSLHPANLVQLVSPYALQSRIYAPAPGEHFMHEFGVYDGAIATVALCWIALRWRDLQRRGYAAAFLSLAALGLVLALGRYGAVYPILAHLPGISSLRAPTRHILLMHFAFAGLVALAIEDLVRVRAVGLSWRQLGLLAAPLMLSIVVSGVVFVAAERSSHSVAGIGVSGVAAALAGTGFMLATTLLFALGGRGYRIAVPALVVLTALDLFCWGTRYIYATPPVSIASVMPGGGLPPEAREGDLVHPSAMRNDMNQYPMWGLRSSTVYLGLVRASVLDPHRRIAQRIAGVQWTWTSAGWTALAGTMPRARLLTDCRLSQDPAGDVDRIDISRTALVETPATMTAASTGTARLLVDRAGLLVVQTSAASPQMLALTERFHPGWRADVDGISGPAPQAVYGDFLGVIVPSGEHRVTLRFAPASARIGLWITLAGVAAMVCGALGVAVSGSVGKR